MTKHFTVWTPCLVPFDRVWSCLIKFEGHQTFDQKLKTFQVSSIFEAGMHTTLAQQLVSSVFDQACFNRLATHFSISMFVHRTMFDGFWSPNISLLSGPYTHTKNVHLCNNSTDNS